MEKKKILTIVGPTACGKTARAVSAARALGGEVISADSRQVYKGMDLGTGKDLDEYGDVPYHLIDVAPAGHKYNLYQYLRDYRKALSDIESRGRVPVVCGGTGMYVEAAVRGVCLPEVPENKDLRQSLRDKTLAELTSILAEKKTLHNITDVDTVKRAIRAIEIAAYYEDHPAEAEATRPVEAADAVVIGIDIPRDVRRRRITERLQARLQAGMVDEVRRLIADGIAPADLEYYGLEYKYLTQYVTGRLTYDEMVTGLETAIHQFAKRQMTWFRGMERRGTPIHWLAYDMSEDAFLAALTDLGFQIS